MYVYHGLVERVVDGDTLDLEIDLGFKICTRMRVRLYGVDTPEIYGVKKESEEYQKGMAASQFVRDWLAQHGPRVVIKSHRDEQGKYGRYIVSLYSLDETSCLNEELVTNGHAEEVFYD